ncbi:MAG: histidine kinase, partial [Comamonadaceae bacterium]
MTSSVDDEKRRLERPAMPLRLFVGFMLAGLATVVIALFTYQTNQNRAAAVARINAAVEVISQVQAVLSTLKNAETGQRGYLLTGKENYLEPFSASEGALGQEFQILRQLLEDSPEQLARLDSVQRLASQKMDELRRTIALHRSSRHEEALALVQSDTGLVLMNNIRTTLRDMLQAERQALEARRRTWEEAATFGAYFTWGSSLLLLVLICASAAMTAADHRT